MSTAAAIRAMLASGLTIEQALIAVEAVEEASRNGRGMTNAERQAKYRAQLDVSKEEWGRLRAAVLERDDYICVYCGSDGGGYPLHADHVWPLSKGGRSTLENLVCACRECNCGKSGRTIAEWFGPNV